jgi:hypothetical protein
MANTVWRDIRSLWYSKEGGLEDDYWKKVEEEVSCNLLSYVSWPSHAC